VRQAQSYAANRRPSRLVIHKKNGGIQEERAYGEDVQASPRSQKPKLGEPYSFLHFARSLNLDGPEDWSARIDDYLYGHLSSTLAFLENRIGEIEPLRQVA